MKKPVFLSYFAWQNKRRCVYTFTPTRWNPPWHGKGDLSKEEVSPSASTRRARRKRICSHTLLRTRFKTNVCSCYNLSLLDCDLCRECLTAEIDRLSMLCWMRLMSDDNKCRSYDLKVRRTLDKSWLSPPLVCEQHKNGS